VDLGTNSDYFSAQH